MATTAQLTTVLSLDGERAGKTLAGFDDGGLVSQFAGALARGGGAPPGLVRIRANDHAILSVNGTLATPPIVGTPSIDLPPGTVLDLNLEGAPLLGSIRGVFFQADLAGTIDLRVEAD